MALETAEALLLRGGATAQGHVEKAREFRAALSSKETAFAGMLASLGDQVRASRAQMPLAVLRRDDQRAAASAAAQSAEGRALAALEQCLWEEGSTEGLARLTKAATRLYAEQSSKPESATTAPGPPLVKGSALPSPLPSHNTATAGAPSTSSGTDGETSGVTLRVGDGIALLAAASEAAAWSAGSRADWAAGRDAFVSGLDMQDEDTELVLMLGMLGGLARQAPD